MLILVECVQGGGCGAKRALGRRRPGAPPLTGAHPMDLEPVRVDRAAGAVQEGQGIGTDGSAAISPSAQMD